MNMFRWKCIDVIAAFSAGRDGAAFSTLIGNVFSTLIGERGGQPLVGSQAIQSFPDRRRDHQFGARVRRLPGADLRRLPGGRRQ